MRERSYSYKWYRSSSWSVRPWIRALATAEFTYGLQHPRPKTVTRWATWWPSGPCSFWSLVWTTTMEPEYSVRKNKRNAYSTVEYGAVGLLNFERNQRGLNTVENIQLLNFFFWWVCFDTWHILNGGNVRRLLTHTYIYLYLIKNK